MGQCASDAKSEHPQHDLSQEDDNLPACVDQKSIPMGAKDRGSRRKSSTRIYSPDQLIRKNSGSGIFTIAGGDFPVPEHERKDSKSRSKFSSDNVKAKNRRNSTVSQKSSGSTGPEDSGYYDPETSVYVQNVVKKSGCETFVINFNESEAGDKHVKSRRRPPKLKTRPQTAAVSDNTIKVKPSSTEVIDCQDFEVTDSYCSGKILDKKRLRSAFARSSGSKKKDPKGTGGM